MYKMKSEKRQDFVDGAIREVKEELNINTNKDNIELILSFKREHDFVDVWLIRQNVRISDIILQKEEVSKVKYVSFNELEKMIKAEEFVSSVNLYFDLFKKY